MKLNNKKKIKRKFWTIFLTRNGRSRHFLCSAKIGLSFLKWSLEHPGISLSEKLKSSLMYLFTFLVKRNLIDTEKCSQFRARMVNKIGGHLLINLYLQRTTCSRKSDRFKTLRKYSSITQEKLPETLKIVVHFIQKQKNKNPLLLQNEFSLPTFLITN